MMGRLNHDQGRLFYSFCLEEAVPDDHLVWVHAELAPHYPGNGRPSIDPELMIRMLIIGYVFAVRSRGPSCQAGNVRRMSAISRRSAVEIRSVIQVEYTHGSSA
jgi:hypothetical protein